MPVTRIIEGLWADLPSRKLRPARVGIIDGIISEISWIDEAPPIWILPGFIDAHVHIESSMLTPGYFAHLAVRHGSIATVSDPHEIANVLGLDGVRYMIDEGNKVPFHFCFGAPSCVPATPFETAGAVLGPNEVAEMLAWPEISYLAEMMNFPGVIHEDISVLAKINAALALEKPVDGHAPGLRGADLDAYLKAGISTDHECFTLEEGREKIAKGMKVLIREGSAAKNFDALWPLIAEAPDRVMLCSDDKHPDDLMNGHINLLVARGLANGLDLFDLIEVACVNPILHYNLPIPLPQVGKVAQLVICEPDTLKVLTTIFKGEILFDDGKVCFDAPIPPIVNRFTNVNTIQTNLAIPVLGDEIRVIKAIEGQLVTNGFTAKPLIEDGFAISDVDRDILKMAVVNRYEAAPPALGFIQGFGLASGALASTVGHDCHNIMAVGTNDQMMQELIEKLGETGGGIAIHTGQEIFMLPLPIAGLMSNLAGEQVAQEYEFLNAKSKELLGCVLEAPFMTLSFMALLVIPEWKLGDKGLFQTSVFGFKDLWLRD